MKYLKIFTVNGVRKHLVSDSWTLEIESPGRGIATIKSDEMCSGLVTLDMGIIGELKKISRWFTGYIESCTRIDKCQVRLMIREMGAVLAARWPIALRNVTARDVLTELSAQTGLAFNIEESEWAQTSIPHFINIASGYEALDLLGKHLQIDRFRWQCQPDGSIYVGSAAGTSADKKIIQLPANIFTETSIVGTTCALLPSLRPGQRIQIGDGPIREINAINTTDEKMRMGWA